MGSNSGGGRYFAYLDESATEGEESDDLNDMIGGPFAVYAIAAKKQQNRLNHKSVKKESKRKRKARRVSLQSGRQRKSSMSFLNDYPEVRLRCLKVWKRAQKRQRPRIYCKECRSSKYLLQRELVGKGKVLEALADEINVCRRIVGAGGRDVKASKSAVSRTWKVRLADIGVTCCVGAGGHSLFGFGTESHYTLTDDKTAQLMEEIDQKVVEDEGEEKADDEEEEEQDNHGDGDEDNVVRVNREDVVYEEVAAEKNQHTTSKKGSKKKKKRKTITTNKKIVRSRRRKSTRSVVTRTKGNCEVEDEKSQGDKKDGAKVGSHRMRRKRERTPAVVVRRFSKRLRRRQP